MWASMRKTGGYSASLHGLAEVGVRGTAAHKPAETAAAFYPSERSRRLLHDGYGDSDRCATAWAATERMRSLALALQHDA